MPNSTTKTTIFNRGLQLVGYGPVSSPEQVGNRGAKAMRTAYTPTLLSELQKHYWVFSMKRASLPAATIPPVHTMKFRYPLPGDYLMLAPEDDLFDFPAKRDWIEEEGHIVTNDTAPLPIRYVSNSITEASFSAIFAEAFAAALAVATGEELTQSAGKIARAEAIYIVQINLGKKRNSILSPKPRAPATPWLTKRV